MNHLRESAKTLMVLALLYANQALAASSANYELSVGGLTGGSSSQSSVNYQLTLGYLSLDIVGTASSNNYLLEAGILPGDMVGASVAPTGSVRINGDASHAKSTTVTLNLSCLDSDGCSSSRFSNDGATWSDWESYTTARSNWCLGAYDGLVCVAPEGQRIVFAQFRDKVGQVSITYSDTIILDTTAPTISITPVGGYFSSSQTVTISSEPGKIFYTIDGSTPSTVSPLYGAALAISTDTTLKVLAQDWAFNETLATPQTYTFCKGIPLTLTGTLRDAGTGSLLVGATVYLSNGQSKVTGSDGKYTFSSLSFGDYTLSMSIPYYRPYLDKVTMCKADTVTRDITLGRVESVFGSLTTTGVANGSVNTATGNYFTQATDLQWVGRGVPLQFTRTYNSLDPTNGPLGFGWTHSYNMRVWTNSDSSVTVRWGSGSTETWAWDATTSTYKGKLGVFNKLIKNADGTFRVRRKDMVEFNFNSSNLLSSIKDQNGNTVTLTYTSGVLTYITDSVGRQVALTYNPDKKIIELSEVSEPYRKIKYTYDGNGDLWTVSNRDNADYTAVTTYTYSAHQLLTITDPRLKKVATNTYDSQKRLVAEEDYFGNRTSYEYEESPERRTKITDPELNISWHYFDDNLYLKNEVDQLSNTAEYTYDAYGNRTITKDKRGNIITSVFAEPATGNATQVTRDMGANTDVVTNATYDADNNPLTKTDANGTVTTYTYTAGNLTKMTLADPAGVDPRGYVIEYKYNAYGQVTEKKAYLDMGKTNFVTWQYGYDSQGNQTSSTDPEGNQTTCTYDTVGRKITETDPLMHTTTYWYDNMDRVTRIQDALGSEIVYTYDRNGNLVTKTDQNRWTTTYFYDEMNRLIMERNPLLQPTTYTYDKHGRKAGLTNALGELTKYSYDAVGNLESVTDPRLNVTRSTYDPNGNRLTAKDARGYVTSFEYDPMNRLVKRTDPYGRITTTTYDQNGNIQTVTDPLNHVTAYTYDKWTRLLTVTDAENGTTTNIYDALGRVVSVTDAEGRTTSFEYDRAGRLRKVADPENGPLGKFVTATYDKAGNRRTVTDTRGKTTEYEYDELNRLKAETDPLLRRTTYGYDLVGNRTGKVDPELNMTIYNYDQVNRLAKVTYPDSSTVSYAYNAAGARSKMTDSVGVTSYVYWENGPLKRVTDPFGLVVSYEYDEYLNRTAIVYPGPKRVEYAYDKLNRLVGVVDWDGVHTTYDYDEAGRLVSQTMGNGATVVYDYDKANHLTDKTDKTSGGDIIAQYQYLLDKVGNRTQVTMTQPLLPKGATSSTDFTYDDSNQIVTAGGATYTFDVRGNIATRVKDGVTTNYQFDHREMLTQVNDGVNIDQYRYNGDGDRLVSIRNGVTTRYLLDTNGSMEFVLADMNAANVVQRYYLYGDGLLYSVNPTTGERLYHHYDPIGNTIGTTDDSEKIVDKFAYLPYGKIASQLDASSTPYKYVGRFGVRTEQNQLCFMRARYYDTESSSFLSEDPVTGKMDIPQTLNQYAYALNDPMLYSDPKGEIVPILAVVGVIAVTVIIEELGRYALPYVVQAACSLPWNRCDKPSLTDITPETAYDVGTFIVDLAMDQTKAANKLGKVRKVYKSALEIYDKFVKTKKVIDIAQDIEKDLSSKKEVEVYNDQKPKSVSGSGGRVSNSSGGNHGHGSEYTNLVNSVDNVQTSNKFSGWYVDHNSDGSTTYTKTFHDDKTTVEVTVDKNGDKTLRQYK